METPPKVIDDLNHAIRNLQERLVEAYPLAWGEVSCGDEMTLAFHNGKQGLLLYIDVGAGYVPLLSASLKDRARAAVHTPKLLARLDEQAGQLALSLTKATEAYYACAQQVEGKK